ncbi:hypothetical protein N7456_004810 [Penicillium angulare]|uniref:Uncharacterized protein n=1 Tax=Penicillium angulare TaxID=116970 RepID=A0A9W9KIY4_9EURO|nr:hypothetical protein N7456_004810 [Penicillium angulare]
MQGNVMVALMIGILLAVAIVGWIVFCWYQRHVNLAVRVSQAHAKVNANVVRDREHAGHSRHDIERGIPLQPPKYTQRGWTRASTRVRSRDRIVREASYHLMKGTKPGRPAPLTQIIQGSLNNQHEHYRRSTRGLRSEKNSPQRSKTSRLSPRADFWRQKQEQEKYDRLHTGDPYEEEGRRNDERDQSRGNRQSPDKHSSRNRWQQGQENGNHENDDTRKNEDGYQRYQSGSHRRSRNAGTSPSKRSHFEQPDNNSQRNERNDTNSPKKGSNYERRNNHQQKEERYGDTNSNEKNDRQGDDQPTRNNNGDFNQQNDNQAYHENDGDFSQQNDNQAYHDNAWGNDNNGDVAWQGEDQRNSDNNECNQGNSGNEEGYWKNNDNWNNQNNSPNKPRSARNSAAPVSQKGRHGSSTRRGDQNGNSESGQREQHREKSHNGNSNKYWGNKRGNNSPRSRHNNSQSRSARPHVSADGNQYGGGSLKAGSQAGDQVGVTNEDGLERPQW